MRSTVDALQGFPALADANMGRQAPLVRLAREDDAFELCVGQPALADDVERQFRSVGRARVRDGGHRRGLDQGRRMGLRTGNGDGCRAPGFVGPGGARRRHLGGCRHSANRGIAFGCGGGLRCGLVVEFGDGTPTGGWLRLGGGASVRGGCGSVTREAGRRFEGKPAGGSARAGFRGQRPARRHVRLHGLEQLRGIGRGGAGIEGSAGVGLFVLAARQPVENRQASVERGAVARIGPSVDGHGEDRLRGRIEITERGLPDRAAGDAGMGRDGHEPAAGRQHGKRGTDMAQIRVVPAALDPGADRERGVHQHRRRHEPGQVIRDGLGVAPVDGNARKEPFEQSRPGRGEFVEVELLAGGRAERTVGHDGEDAGAGRRFQHPVAGADHGRLNRGIGQRQGRGELLQSHLFFGSPGMGGFER